MSFTIVDGVVKSRIATQDGLWFTTNNSSGRNMRLYCLLKVFIISLAIATVFTTSAQSYAYSRFQGTVKKVIDGDSIIVSNGKKRIEIRLYGIDSPEYDQPFAKKAKKYLKNRILKRNVLVEGYYKDRYGRLVATVYISGKAINHELVSEGLAWVFKKYCRKSMCKDWKKSEIIARREQLYVWSEPDPVPPWEWKRRKNN